MGMASARAIRFTGGCPLRLREKFSKTIQSCPTANAKLVRTRNFVKSRRATSSSCGQSIGKSFRHCGWSWYARPSGGTEPFSSDVIEHGLQHVVPAYGLVFHRGQHVEVLDAFCCWRVAGHHHVYLGRDRLIAELERVDRLGARP